MRQRGFSLLEVLVAVTLLALGFAAVFAGMSGSIKGLERAAAADHRVELARMKLAELDLIKKIRPLDTASGVFEDGTKWTLSSSPFIVPIAEGVRRNSTSVIRIDLTMEWPGRSGPQRQVIQTYRFQREDTNTSPSLEEQLRELQ
jgi:prepilin-type N-terminal cleavage/methylation domain-containing protein